MAHFEIFLEGDFNFIVPPIYKQRSLKLHLWMKIIEQ